MDFTNYWFSKNAQGGGGFDPGDSIGNSLRFRPQAYLQRDNFSGHPAGHENTYSLWVKLGDLSGGATNQYVFDRGSASYFRWYDEHWTSYGGGAVDSNSNSMARDPHAWYHLCWQTDNYATSGKMWVNGEEITLSAYDLMNDIYGGTFYIGINRNLTTSVNWTGYMSEVIYIDGRKEDVSAFGRYNENGVWVPKKPDFAVQSYSSFVYGADSTTYGENNTEKLFISGNFGPQYGFDGNNSTGCNMGSGAIGGNWGYFRPPGGINDASVIRINTQNVGAIRFNGVQVGTGNTNGSGSPQWQEFNSPPASVTEIAFQGASGFTPQFNNIEVDGEMLIDSTVWSSMITDTGFASGSQVSYFFEDNGLSSTFSPPGPAIFTPVTPLHVNEKVSLWVESSNVAFSVNGGSSVTAVQGQYTDIPFTGDLTQVTIEWGVGEASLTRLAIDGNQLIDGKNFSFGPEGFYLDFADPNTIGNDVSGNNNHFTDTGFTLDNPNSPNYDLCTDTPSQNHAVLSPLWRGSVDGRYGQLSHANLRSGPGNNNADDSVSTLEITEKTYLEFMTTVAGADQFYPGLITMDINNMVAGQYEFYGNGTNSSGIANNTDPWNADDVVRIEIDPTVNPPTIGIAVNNGAFTYNDMPAYTQDTKIGIGVKGANNGYAVINYGQKPWRYGPEEGFAGLSTLNMEEPPIFDGRDHFQALIGPGDGVSEVTFPNQLSGNWTSYLSANPGGFRTDYPVEYAFNGVGNSATALQGSATIEFKPATPIAYTSQVRVGPNHSVASPGEYSFNYGPWTAFPGPWPGYNIEDYATNGFTIASGSGDLESIRIRRLENDDQPSCIFIQVDDDILLDAGILQVAQQTFPNGLWWIKDRVNVNQHQLLDSVRGGNIALTTPGSDQQTYVPPSGNSVAWAWRAGGSAVTNNDGSIASQVSANTQAGFSIVTYTGNATSGATIGHGLDKAPEFIIGRNYTDVEAFPVFHIGTDPTNPANYWLRIDRDAAAVSSQPHWNNTSPDDSVFTVGDANATNGSGDSLVAYCWTSVPGYSSFGSYVGNGSGDGPAMYCGFKPAFIMIKNASTAQHWVIHDSTRSIINPSDDYLFPDDTAIPTSSRPIDFLSTGFKIRSDANQHNQPGNAYIYAAFAENPTQSPTTAR